MIIGCKLRAGALTVLQKGIETQTFESPAFGAEGFMRSMDSAVQALMEAQLYERANDASKIITAFLVRFPPPCDLRYRVPIYARACGSYPH